MLFITDCLIECSICSMEFHVALKEGLVHHFKADLHETKVDAMKTREIRMDR